MHYGLLFLSIKRAYIWYHIDCTQHFTRCQPLRKLLQRPLRGLSLTGLDLHLHQMSCDLGQVCAFTLGRFSWRCQM